MKRVEQTTLYTASWDDEDELIARLANNLVLIPSI